MLCEQSRVRCLPAGTRLTLVFLSVALLFFGSSTAALAASGPPNYYIGKVETLGSGNAWRGTKSLNYVSNAWNQNGDLKLNAVYLETIGVGYEHYLELGWHWDARYSNPEFYYAYENAKTGGVQAFGTVGNATRGSSPYLEVNVFQYVPANGGNEAYWEWRAAHNGTLDVKSKMQYSTGWSTAWEERWSVNDNPWSHFWALGKKNGVGSWSSWSNSSVDGSNSYPGTYNGNPVYVSSPSQDDFTVTY